MSEIQCFLIEPTEECEVRLRRFVFSDSCPAKAGYHNASSGPLWREPFPLSNTFNGDHTGRHDHADARWPVECECGYVFQESDQWQVCRERLYKRADTGEQLTQKSAPAGAMWDDTWRKDIGFKWYTVQPDGYLLTVKTPDGEWCIDGPANNGGGWTRTGTVPRVTAMPSILSGSYHGWLTDGVLREC